MHLGEPLPGVSVSRAILGISTLDSDSIGELSLTAAYLGPSWTGYEYGELRPLVSNSYANKFLRPHSYRPGHNLLSSLVDTWDMTSSGAIRSPEMINTRDLRAIPCWIRINSNLFDKSDERYFRSRFTVVDTRTFNTIWGVDYCEAWVNITPHSKVSIGAKYGFNYAFDLLFWE